MVKYEKLSDAALAEPAAAPLVGAWRDVADRFKTAASMHVYVTGSGGKALPPHTDTTDVLVAQLRGSKEWQVCAPSKDKARFASTAFRAELLEAERGSHGCSQFEQELRDEPELSCETYVPAPGDSLYLPKGVAHSAVATDDSAHLTVGLKRVTWHRVFDEYLDRPGSLAPRAAGRTGALSQCSRPEAPPTRRARAKRALKTLEAAGDASAVPWRRAPRPGRSTSTTARRCPAATRTSSATRSRRPSSTRWAATRTWPKLWRTTTSLSMPCGPRLSPRSLWARSPPCSTRERATSRPSSPARAAPRATTAAVDWEAMHPSASANTLTLAAGPR